MKKVLLVCAAILVAFVAACEAEEEPAPTPFLPLPTEPDATPDSDSSEGDVVSSDVADASDDAAVVDTAVSDVPEDTAVEDAAEVSEADTVADTVEDVEEEDVPLLDVFEPGTTEGACLLAGNPNEAQFQTVQHQTEILKAAIIDCMKKQALQGDDFYSCIREYVMAEYSCTEDCAQCFATRADCMKTFCFGGCLNSPTADEDDCDQCQIENYCLNPFQSCTGLAVF